MQFIDLFNQQSAQLFLDGTVVELGIIRVSTTTGGTLTSDNFIHGLEQLESRRRKERQQRENAMSSVSRGHKNGSERNPIPTSPTMPVSKKPNIVKKISYESFETSEKAVQSVCLRLVKDVAFWLE